MTVQYVFEHTELMLDHFKGQIGIGCRRWSLVRLLSVVCLMVTSQKLSTKDP